MPTRVEVLVRYPRGSNSEFSREQFFNEKPELSARILIERSQIACFKINKGAVAPISAGDLSSVSIGDLMLPGIDLEHNPYRPWGIRGHASDFIDLNAYLWANGL
jgi:hypothetical protein